MLDELEVLLAEAERASKTLLGQRTRFEDAAQAANLKGGTINDDEESE